MPKTNLSFPLLLSLGLINSGCLTLNARNAKKACELGRCAGLNLEKAGELSKTPDTDLNDTEFVFKALDPREAQEGLTVQVQSKKRCRAVRHTTDLFKHSNTGLFWADVGMAAGGGGLIGAALSTEGTVATALIASGGALAAYAIADLTAHAFTAKMKLKRVDRGEYIDCDNYIPLPDGGTFESLFPSLNPEVPIRLKSEREEERHLLKQEVMGFAHLENPSQPELKLKAYLNDSQQALSLPSPKPPKRAWICEAMSKISAFQVSGEPEDWKIYFEFDVDLAPAVLPWTYPDGRTTLGANEDYLKLCPQDDRDHLANIANEIIQESPEAFPVLAEVLDEIIGQDLYRPDPKARYPRRSKPKRTSQKTTKKKGAKRAGGKSTAPKDPMIGYDAGRPPIGRYRCRQEGKLANLSIRRDGSFSLNVELERGSAYGICGEKTCEVKKYSGAAKAFTSSSQILSLSKVGKTLLINRTTMCDKL